MNPTSPKADNEIILRLLRKIERRIRADRLAGELTVALSVVLTIPIALKIWDLYRPLGGTTVTTIVGISALAFSGYAVWRILNRGSLFEAAASIDEKANLYDAMTSASWFIHKQNSSNWISAQIENAARNAENLDLSRLYPRRIPRTLYTAAMLFILFIGLNFIPLSLNHNWLKLQAAPTGIPPQPIKQNVQKIDEALKRMAQDLLRSEKTERTAEALMQKQLQKAADELRKLANQMKAEPADSSQAMQRLQESLDDASKQSQPELEKLTQALAKAARGMKNKDQESAQEALQSAASELEHLEKNGRERDSKNGTGQRSQPRPEVAQQQNKGESGQSKQASDEKSESESDGVGHDPTGTPPQQGEAKTLGVQLEQERLAGMPLGGSIPEEVHESSKQQLSRLEYSSVQSELRAGRKDLMNQDTIPWEYRSLVKDYLQAIRP